MGENRAVVSAASVCEAAIKKALGKISFEQAEWQMFAESQGFGELPVRD